MDVGIGDGVEVADFTDSCDFAITWVDRPLTMGGVFNSGEDTIATTFACGYSFERLAVESGSRLGAFATGAVI